MVALAPGVYAGFDGGAEGPVVGELGVALVDEEDAVVAEVEVHEGGFVVVGLVLAEERGVLVVPVDLDGWVGVVEAGRGATDPLFGEGALGGKVGGEVDLFGGLRGLSFWGECCLRGGDEDAGDGEREEGAAV